MALRNSSKLIPATKFRTPTWLSGSLGLLFLFSFVCKIVHRKKKSNRFDQYRNMTSLFLFWKQMGGVFLRLVAELINGNFKNSLSHSYYFYSQFKTDCEKLKNIKVFPKRWCFSNFLGINWNKFFVSILVF